MLRKTIDVYLKSFGIIFEKIVLAKNIFVSDRTLN